jgi:uncharacterized protein (TIGR02646 family)
LRNLATRHCLPAHTTRHLHNGTQTILAAADRTAESSRQYSAARRANWFRAVTEALSLMAGPGERCMGCSGSEAAQVEHFRPKATYPELALQWQNLLWLCGLCNHYKGMRFDEAVTPINPIDDNVWDHFYINEFGMLCARWDNALNDLDPRAVQTIELLGLDRQALQESRQARLTLLRQMVRDSLQLLEDRRLTLDDVERRALEWFEQPLQPDVADYFFEGPGRLDDSEPFKHFFEILSA